MNRYRKTAATIVGAAAATIVTSTILAGTASAVDIPRPLPENCGKNGFSQVAANNYFYAYELYKTEGNVYRYMVSVPNVPAGFVPIGETSCTK